MALDPSIILNLKPIQIPSQMDGMAQMMALRDLVNRDAMTQAQMQEHGLKMQQLRQAAADDDVMRKVAVAAGGDLGKFAEALRQRGLFKPAMELDKQRVEQEAKRAQMGKDSADAIAKNLQSQREVYGQVAADPSDASVQSLFASPVAASVFGEGSGPMAQRLLSMDPNQRKSWAMLASLQAKDRLEAMLPKFSTVNDNKTTRFVDTNPMTNPNLGATQFAMQTTPDADQRNAAALAELQERARHNKQTEAAAFGNLSISRDRLAFDKAQPKGQIVEGRDGFMLVDPRAGTATPVTAQGEPVKGKDQRPPEAYLKQMAGVNSLQSAIDSYVKELGTWSTGKMIIPSERARIGTAYNNMMLQAKEAYNLGVLNGPDYSILQSVIADPTKATSAIISNDALRKQATELKGLMNRTAERVSQAYNQPTPKWIETDKKEPPAQIKLSPQGQSLVDFYSRK